MKMTAHISSICRALYFLLRKISSIRKYISNATCKTLVVSLIFSRLDYCNSLFVNLPQTSIYKLQLLQNNAARLVLGKRKFDHATPLLASLHWLPIEKRSVYKAACLIYKCLDGKAPAYLMDHVVTCNQENYNLRSCNDKTKLIEQRSRTKFGDRSFAIFGPKIWNELPRDLRESGSLNSFKKNLKTYLYCASFN